MEKPFVASAEKKWDYWDRSGPATIASQGESAMYEQIGLSPDFGRPEPAPSDKDQLFALKLAWSGLTQADNELGAAMDELSSARAETANEIYDIIANAEMRLCRLVQAIERIG
jgi:hypothetical protein